MKVSRFIVKRKSTAEYLIYLDNFLVHSTDREKEEDHSLGTVYCEVANKATEDPLRGKHAKYQRCTDSERFKIAKCVIAIAEEDCSRRAVNPISKTNFRNYMKGQLKHPFTRTVVKES